MAKRNDVTTFTVAVPRPETHLFEIAMEIAPFTDPVDRFDLVLPAWAPGSYLIREFARHVRDLTVTEGREGSRRRLHVEKVEKARWRVTLDRASRGPFRATYAVYAHDLSVRTSHVDASHAYGNGTNLFLYVDGRKGEPQALRFELPAGWRASIALPASGGVFRALDYDELVDSPFECGTHRLLRFRVLSREHTVALWGEGNEDTQRLVRDLTRLVKTAASLFDGLPYERYLFIVHVAAGAGGGLEHRASQSVGMSPFAFRPESKYRDVLFLFAHELFHAWNVKRIRPRGFDPFDYEHEVYTRDLWALEGITSYYDVLLPVRAGLVEEKHAFAEWMKELKAHRENPGSSVQSAEMASFDTWIRYYRPDENSPNVSESYYRRGALIGLALDLAIRKRTRGRRSLDDVMRRLFTAYGKKGLPYPDGAWEEAVHRVLGPSTSRFFERFVRGVETPPFESLVRAAGLELEKTPEKDDDGRSARERGDFGWKVKAENGRLVVSEVYAGRAAEDGGIAPGDELVALDAVKATEEHVKRVEREGEPGDEVSVSLFRRQRLLTREVKLGRRRALEYALKRREGTSPAERRFYRSWLARPFPKD